MPRVLHVISGLGVGGAEMALYRLVASAKGGVYKHTVVALTPGGAMEDRLRNAGIELTTFDFKAAPIAQFFNLLLLMRRSRPDIVQTWMYHADMFGGVAARLSGNRNIIWGVRTSELTAGSARFTVVVRRACAFLSRWVPHTIVCVAEAARRSHVQEGYDAKRMVVVPNGFDLSRLVADGESMRKLRERCGFRQGDIVVGSVGRFNISKDQANFVRAAGILAHRHTNLRFLMVGRDLDTHNAELMRWIAETGFPERFVLLGERADVPVCLAAMDVFCLSSRNEGFPNVAGEAMAMGLPCVVTDVGDAALLLGDTGVVVPKEDSEALAHGIDTLLGMSPEGRRKLGLRAKDRIHAEFTVERTRERFETLYQRLTEESES
ncbi:MAG TPA: glycosyltransferase [Noviherbaspirillum sp.]|nr:glycosyltransferase [Noviherbaspirillum sp.]